MDGTPACLQHLALGAARAEAALDAQHGLQLRVHAHGRERLARVLLLPFLLRAVEVGGRGDVCGVLGCREVGRLLLWLRLRRRRLLLLLALSPSLPREQLCSQLEVVELLGSLGLRRLLPCLLPTRISTL